VSFKSKLDRLVSKVPSNAPTLDELRERMRALMEPTSPTAAFAGRPSEPVGHRGRLEDLGFAEAANDVGQFWHRRVVLRRSERVGRATLHDAVSARIAPLALLALDAKLATVRLEQALYLDTETTGLGGGAGTFAFLIGLSWFEADAKVFEQFFLAGPEQEPAVLVELEKRLARAALLVSYNGKSFDWPLLRTRFVYNRMKVPSELPHLDLLHVARRVHGRRIGRCSLKDVENRVLGFERSGDIEGALVAAYYGHYLRTGDATELVRVVEHNAMDVRSLSALVALYGDERLDLDARDLASVSRTFRRAKDFARAESIASEAISRGGGAIALRARAEVNKAIGDRLLALKDFEAAEAEESDPDTRLELVKLYEHYAKDPARALELLQRGTSELLEQSERRAVRLAAKLERARSKAAKKPRIC
jgi:uncharacterized protein